MPRGMHPNSRKALEENRHKGSFTAGNAVEMSEKSAEKKRQMKSFREQFAAELAAEIVRRDEFGNITDKTTVKDAITKQIVQKALRGNTRAFELIRDTIGEKPADNIIVTEIDPDVAKEVEAIVNDTD